MTLQRVDARFLLPFDLDGNSRVAAGAGWVEGLAAADLETVEPGTEADLATGSLAELPTLLASRPRTILIEGDARRDLQGAGYDVRAFVALPDPQRIRILLTPEHGAAAAYGVRTLVHQSSLLRRLRRNAGAGLLRRGILPPRLPLISIGYRGATTPFLIAAAERELGIDPLGWFFATGPGDVLTRNLYFLFRPGRRSPEWVLKFVRAPSYDRPFQAEAAALHEVARVGPVVMNHVPATAARLDVGGRPAVIESAAHGRQLNAVLTHPGREADKIAALERVLEWLLRVASASRGSREQLAGEWRRMQELARGISLGLPHEPFFDPVLQHNDLGGWNVIANGETFTVLDWETSRRYGSPLWDMWFLLVHALPVLAGVEESALDGYVRRLLRGDERWSDFFFLWTRRAAAEAGIAERDIGTLATLCWLHHAGTRSRRIATFQQYAPDVPIPDLVRWRLLDIWLSDEALGPAWRALNR